VTSINMKNGDDIDNTLRYFVGGPRSNWTGKVGSIQIRFPVDFAHSHWTGKFLLANYNGRINSSVRNCYNYRL